MFAKPFLSQLGNGHVQGVYSMCKVRSQGRWDAAWPLYGDTDSLQDKHSLTSVASGSGDGVVKVWDLPTRDEAWRTAAQ